MSKSYKIGKYHELKDDEITDFQKGVQLADIQLDDRFIIKGNIEKHDKTLEQIENYFKRSTKIVQSKIGVGPETILDLKLRDSKELEIKNDKKLKILMSPITNELTDALNLVLNGIELIPYKIIEYKNNGLFVKHRDSSHSINQIGTVSVTIQKSYNSPSLNVYGKEGSKYTDDYIGSFIAFHKNIEHEIVPYKYSDVSKERISLVYDVCMVEPTKIIPPTISFEEINEEFSSNNVKFVLHKKYTVERSIRNIFQEYIITNLNDFQEIFISPTLFYTNKYNRLSGLDALMTELLTELGFNIEDIQFVVNKKTIKRLANQRISSPEKYKWKNINYMSNRRHEYGYDNETIDDEITSDDEVNSDDGKINIKIKEARDQTDEDDSKNDDYLQQGILPSKIHCFTEMTPILTTLQFDYSYLGNEHESYWEKPIFTVWRVKRQLKFSENDLLISKINLKRVHKMWYDD
jgi:hypothetical protein